MPNYICRHCQANNPVPGQCVLCLKSLGSHKKAFLAAAISSLWCGTIWLTVAVLFRIQLPALAILFGGIVSATVSRFSGGRGITYQLIATAFTIAGIVSFDGLSLLLIEALKPPQNQTEREGIEPTEPLSASNGFEDRGDHQARVTLHRRL